MGMTPDYLLGMIDADGRNRPSAPVIVRGDADLLERTIEACPHKRKYTSGLLMDEQSLEQLGGKDFLEKLMDDFEEVMFPEMQKDSYVMIFVIHPRKDKKLELNYCVANMQLPSGKSLKAYYDRVDRKRFTLFMEQLNLRHGLSNPNDPLRQRSLYLNPKLPKEKERAIQLIHRVVEHAIEKKRIHDRKSLLEFLADTYEINRQGDNYISIRDSSGRLLRLKGRYYQKDFKAVEEVPRQSVDSQKTKDRLEFLNRELERLCALRSKYLEERYQTKTETTNQEKIDYEYTNTRRGLRRRILGALAGIARRTQSLIQEIAGRDRTRGRESQRDAGQCRGALERGRVEGSTTLERDYSDRRLRDRTSDSQERLHAHRIYGEGSRRRGDEEISAANDALPMFARFLRFLPRSLLRLSRERRDSSKVNPEIQKSGGSEEGPER